MNKTNLKFRMSMDEMYAAYAEAHPEFVPNHANVGRYAKRMGYERVKQMRQGKQIYFYVNPSLRDNG